MVALSDSSVSQRVLRIDRVARLDVYLDDRHVLEVTDIGYFDFNRCHRSCSLPRSENQPAHVFEDVTELACEPGSERAVDHAVII